MRPKAPTEACLSHLTTLGSVGDDTWYPPALIGAPTIGHAAISSGSREWVLRLLSDLTPEPYTKAVERFCEAGESRFGSEWRYADLLTALRACCVLIQPRDYLEIGVRRGRSLAVVAKSTVGVRAVGFDLWSGDYAAVPNPGPEFVHAELTRLGVDMDVTLIRGDSRETVPEYLAASPDKTFDLVTVDGDHSASGAARDLVNVLPRLRVGGALVFDDICHPLHGDLREVWTSLVASVERYSDWEFDEVGYGVAVAVRRW